MNYMAYGLPVLAAVDPWGEVARIVRESEGGWVVDSSRPETFPTVVAELIAQPDELARRGRAAERYAQRHFTRSAFAARFDELLAVVR
jgi:glycosyltransferase involved in cell wall biosynthesis